MPSNDDIIFNITFVPKGKKLTLKEAFTPIGFGVENVAFAAARNRQRRLKQNLYRDFAPIVERELQKMATEVARMGVGRSNSPSGTLSIDGGVSRAMAGDAAPMAISSMTGQWASRSKVYMKYKFRRYRTRRWFKNTGRLQSQLKSYGTYRSAYGPISIRFTPTVISGQSGNISTLGRSSGGQSTNIMIGRLVVNPLRRLRANDLPGIGEKADYNVGLMSPLADSIERKLTGKPKEGKYRPVLEPFLSYYLTRKIPNAVFRKLEASLA